MSNNTEKKIQWHPAFCSAMRLEFLENKNDLDYINEYNLNTKPLQIDLLVIRKTKDILIRNEIGRLFRGHNITEYKSPDDSLNVDTYYKVLAYACLYKASGEYVDSVKADEITISIIREAYPRELMKFFKTNGYKVTRPFDGIYYVKKDGFFDTQIIVSRQLKGSSHIWVKSLTESLQHHNAQELIYNLNSLKGNAEKEYGDSVLEVAMQANPISFNMWKKEDSNMCEALRQLMKPEIDEMLSETNEKLNAINEKLSATNEKLNAANKKIDETEKKANAAMKQQKTEEAKQLINFVENAAKNFNTTLEAACQALGISMDSYLKAKASLNITSQNQPSL